MIKKFGIGVYCTTLWILAVASFIAIPLFVKDHDFSIVEALLHFLLGLGIGAIIIGIDIFVKRKSSSIKSLFSRGEIHQGFPIIGFLLSLWGLLTRDELLLISLGSVLLILAVHITILWLLGPVSRLFKS